LAGLTALLLDLYEADARRQIGSSSYAVIFNGTFETDEIFAIVVCFINFEFSVQKPFGLGMYNVSFDSKQLARELCRTIFDKRTSKR
jgi:hypothetical protein